MIGLEDSVDFDDRFDIYIGSFLPLYKLTKLLWRFNCLLLEIQFLLCDYLWLSWKRLGCWFSSFVLEIGLLALLRGLNQVRGLKWALHSIVATGVEIFFGFVLGAYHSKVILELGNIFITHGFGKLFLAQIIMRPTQVTHLIKRIIRPLLLSFLFRQQHPIIFWVTNLRNQLAIGVNLNIVITSLIGCPIGTIIWLALLLLLLFWVFCLLFVEVVEIVYNSGWWVWAEL